MRTMTTPSAHARRFVPAAGHAWLLPLYDPFVRWLGNERATKGALIEQAAIAPGHHVLDLGCGTGTLAVWIAQRHPEAHVTGVDPDPQALALAEKKARAAGVAPHFDPSFGDGLPYEDDRFDRVLSSFVFHHLDPDEKRGTLAEVRRVLRPGGTLHLLDFGPALSGERGLFARLLHHHENLDDNLSGRLPDLMRGAGFATVEQVDDRTGVLGTMAYYRAS